jgi:twitching motility protein PilI
MMADTGPLLSNFVALAARYDHCSLGLPAQADLTPIRTVICFKVMGANVAIPLEEIAEILEMPHCTPLPRVKSWVRGIANVRGKLLPVIDFASFLGGRNLTSASQQKVVLLDIDSRCVGLQVDAVQGMRHFRFDAYDGEATSDLESIRPYIVGAFNDGDDSWFVLRPEAVARDERFVDVAL